MKVILTLLALGVLSLVPTYGQAVDIAFSVGDGAESRTLYLGLDTSATNGLDAALGEQELPPLPPSGTFEARFIGTNVSAELGQGSYRDYRKGGADFTGEVEHQMQWQLGTGTVFTIEYDLPPGVTARLEDFFGGAVLNKTVSGAGMITVSNTALTQAKVTMIYGGDANVGNGRMETPAEFALHSPHPNPVSSYFGVRYSVEVPTSIRLALYDLLGRTVAVLAEEAHVSGTHEAVLDARLLPAGLYLLRLEADRQTVTRRVTVVR